MDDCLDILCINCHEMVNVCSITDHSQICVHPHEDVKSFSESLEMAQIDAKIIKILSSLENIIFKRTTDRTFYRFLHEKAIKLIAVREINTESVENSSFISTELRTFSKKMIRPNLIIYSERLRELASEKTRILIESLASSESSEEILKLLNKKYTEIRKLHSDANENKQSRDHLQLISNCLQNIDEIASQISKAITIKSSIHSEMTPLDDDSEEFNIDELDEFQKIKEKEIEEQQNAELQKIFYSKCLSVKLGSKRNTIGKNSQINELYKKCKDLKIPVDKWDEFIKKELNVSG